MRTTRAELTESGRGLGDHRGGLRLAARRAGRWDGRVLRDRRDPVRPGPLTGPPAAVGDGEPACKPDSVRRTLRPAWVAIHLCGLPGDIGRAGRPTLGLAPGGGCQPPGSPPTLVRSYRTVSPLPVRSAGLPAHRHRRSALCCPVPAGRPVLALASTLALWSPDFPRPGRRSDRAAATGPAHRRPQCTAAVTPDRRPGAGRMLVASESEATSAASAGRRGPGGGRRRTRAGRAS